MKIGVKLGLEIQNLYSKRLWMPSEWVRNEKTKILPLFPENRTEQNQHTEQFQTTDKHKERHDPLTHVGHAAHGVSRTIIAEA